MTAPTGSGSTWRRCGAGSPAAGRTRTAPRVPRPGSRGRRRRRSRPGSRRGGPRARAARPCRRSARSCRRRTRSRAPCRCRASAGVASIATVPGAPGPILTCSRSPATGPSGVVTAVSTSATTAAPSRTTDTAFVAPAQPVAVRYPSGIARLSPATSRPSASMNESDHGSVSICARRSPVPTVTVSALAAVGSTRSSERSAARRSRGFLSWKQRVCLCSWGCST